MDMDGWAAFLTLFFFLKTMKIYEKEKPVATDSVSFFLKKDKIFFNQKVLYFPMMSKHTDYSFYYKTARSPMSLS